MSSTHAKKICHWEVLFQAENKREHVCAECCRAVDEAHVEARHLVYFSLDFESEIFLMIWVDGAVVVPVFYVDCCHPIVVR